MSWCDSSLVYSQGIHMCWSMLSENLVVFMCLMECNVSVRFVCWACLRRANLETVVQLIYAGRASLPHLHIHRQAVNGGCGADDFRWCMLCGADDVRSTTKNTATRVEFASTRSVYTRSEWVLVVRVYTLLLHCIGWRNIQYRVSQLVRCVDSPGVLCMYTLGTCFHVSMFFYLMRVFSLQSVLHKWLMMLLASICIYTSIVFVFSMV